MHNKLARKFLSFLLIFSLLFGQLAAPISVLAQEATDSAQVNAADSPEPSTSPSPLVSPEPSQTPFATTEPEASSSATPAPTASPTQTPQPSLAPEPSTIASPSATPIATNSASINDEVKEVSPSAQAKEQNGLKRDFDKKITTSIEEGKIPSRIKSKKGNYVEGEALVRYKKDKINLNSWVDKPQIWLFEQRNDVDVIEEVKDSNIHVVKSEGKETEDLIAQLKQDSSVEIVEPNYIYYLQTTPNDPSFNQLWGLNNTGQTIDGITGKIDADIDASEAWNLEKSEQQDVIVAVIDTGVDYNHPDLKSNLWDGSSCKDQNNNLIPGGCSKHGWNFLKNNNETYDFMGHGTHVSGTIAGVSNNNTGISGISDKNNIKIMMLKIGFDTEQVYLSSVINAVSFAKNNGAKVINASFGGSDYSQIMKDSINSFPGLFIAAAGNYTDNNDVFPLYPASYDNANIVSVAATNQNDKLAGFSSYGATTVDVGAPGENIYSTVPQDPTYTYKAVKLEDFDALTPPNVPSGYSVTGDWGTKSDSSGFNSARPPIASQGGGSTNSVYADYRNRPYKNNANTYFTAPKTDLSSYHVGRINFYTECDTEYGVFYRDYLELYITSDGVNWVLWDRWDEVDLDIYNNAEFDPTGSSAYYLQRILPESFMTQNFQYKFLWHTDDSITGDMGVGCMVDDVLLEGWNYVPSGSTYDYYDGTSMATPHVVGEAAMLMSYKPSLTPSQVKDTILNTGDSIPDLQGKTVSGKRINLFNALASITDNPSTNANLNNLSISNGTLSPNFSPSITGYTASVANNVASITVTPTVEDVKATVTVNGLNVVSGTVSQPVSLNVGSNFITVLVTAESAVTKTYNVVITRAESADTTAPVVTITKDPNKDLSNTNYILTVNYDDAVTKKYKLNNGNLTDYTGSVTVSNEGQHTFYAEGTDAAGNKGTSQVSFAIDKTAPAVTIDSPAVNARVSGITLVSFSITGGTKVECSINNTNWVNCLDAGVGSQGFGSTIALGNITGFDVLPDGQFTFYLKSTDEAGNVANISRSFIKDSYIPNAPGKPTVDAGAFINSAEYSFGVLLTIPLTSSEAEVGDILKIYLNDKEIVSDTLRSEHINNEKYNFTLSSPVLGEDGTKTLTARIIDSLGRVGALSEPLDIVLDTNTPLAPTIDSISNINLANKERIIVSGTAESNALVVIQLTDGNTIVTKEQQLINNNTNYSVELNATSLLDSTINVIAHAKDAAENTSPQTVKTVIKDSTVPTLTDVRITSTNANPNLAKVGDYVTLSFQSSEPITGLMENVFISINETQLEVVYLGNNSYKASKLITENEPEGIIQFEIDYKDLAGNEGEIVRSTTDGSVITVDKIAPVVTGVENGKAYNHDVTPAFDENDASAVLNGVTFHSGTNISTEGEYQLIVVDSAANVTNISFVIDKTAPEITISRNPDKDVANADYFLAITYSGSNVTDYKLDDEDWKLYTELIVVKDEGNHTFQGRGTDLAGNVTTKQVAFRVNKTVPVVVNDSVTSLKNDPITIDSSLLLANDKDLAGDSLTIIEYTNVKNGETHISGSGVTFIPTTDFIGTASFNYIVTDGVNNAQGIVYIVVTPPINDNQTPIQPVVEVSKDKPEVVVVNTDFDTVVNVPSDINNAVLNLTNLATTNEGTKSASINNNITINADTSLGGVQVQLPAGVIISGSADGWNGNINMPTVLVNTSVTPATEPGKVNTTTSVIEVGFGDIKLVFDKAVRLVIPGKAGQLTAYSRNGQFTPITEACETDSQAVGDALPAEGDCRIDSGSDLVIWTKHFTKFATYTQTVSNQTGNNNSSGSSSSSSGGTSAPSAPKCEDTKPGSAPRLVSAVSGENSVILTWEKAKDPVTYYLVAYGTKSGEVKYGNPNIGDKNTTSYTIKGLSGNTTYYFKVRAGNNCMPGEYSNELSATPSGDILDGIATDFQEDILGEDEGTDSAEITDSVKSTKLLEPSKMWGVITILLGIMIAAGLFYYQRRRS